MTETLAAAPATTARQVLHEVFGYGAFRGQQAAVVDHVVAGGDALVLMPTGGGKSLCYLYRPSCATAPARVSRWSSAR